MDGSTEMKVDMVIATYNREDCIEEAVDNCLKYKADFGSLYIIVNGSTDKTLVNLKKYVDEPQVVVLPQKINLGAPGGKNIGLRVSNADVLIVIDDDAEFFSDDPINKAKDVFARYPDIGIIQFKIVNQQMNRIMKYEFPGRDPAEQGDEEFDIGTFTGAGHAIRKSMLEDVGYYPDAYFYAHEELDLSFRAVQGGWRIRYIPYIGVYHKKSPSGRLPEPEMIKNMFLNRMIIARQYLPFIYRVVSDVLWFFKALVWSRSVSVPAKALAEYRKHKQVIKQNLLSPKAMAYLRENYGRLWY